MEQPNIFLIILDTLRVDKLLNSYGNKNLTPFINGLLKNSFFFENCIANSPWTSLLILIYLQDCMQLN